MSVFLPNALFHSFLVQHSNSKLYSDHFTTPVNVSLDWIVLWKRNMDIWMLGKVYWTIDWSLFADMVFEKVREGS